MHSLPARVLAQYRGLWLVAPESEEPQLVPARGRLTETPVTGDCRRARRGRRDRRDRAAPRHDHPPRTRAEATSGHVLAANVDLALVTEPLPDPKARRLERFAALAASGGVQVALALTKADLDEDGPEHRRRGSAGASASSTPSPSAPSPARAWASCARCSPPARPRSCSAPRAPASRRSSTRCSARSARRPARSAPPTGRGRHTTVTRELLTLPSGAHLIDTPGIRIAGLWDGTGESFADVDELALQCRFPDCGHDTEPGCAVRERARPGADRRLAQAAARAGLGRGPPRRTARPRSVAQEDHERAPGAHQVKIEFVIDGTITDELEQAAGPLDFLDEVPE